MKEKISKIFKSKLIKENKKSLIVLSVIILLTLVALIFQKSYAFEGASGTSGDCNWTIDTAGKMIIEPSSGNSCTLQNQNGSIDSSPWYNNSEDITSVEVKPGVKANANSSYLFALLRNATTIDIRNLDTSNVTDMAVMFHNCNSLTSLDLSNFNTSNVTNMDSMFIYCISLTSLDLSNFDISNVTNMSGMFWYCSSLTSLDISNFNTSNVTDMSYMFGGCSSLTSLDVSNFNTSNVTTMDSMFYECSSLTSLNLSNFNTSEVTKMGEMFYKCSNLTSLDVSNFDTSNVTDMRSMFSRCTNLQTIYASGNFNTSNVTLSSSMFTNCSSLVGGNGTVFDSSKVDKEYARIDTANAPGYFTLKVQSPKVTFIKTDKKTGDPVEGVTFKLYGTSDGGEEINKTETSGSNGKVTFEDIPKGTYKLKETSVPEGYKKSNEEITVEVKR